MNLYQLQYCAAMIQICTFRNCNGDTGEYDVIKPFNGDTGEYDVIEPLLKERTSERYSI